MLPCNVILREIEGGLDVSTIDPVASMTGIQNDALKRVAGQVRQMLADVVETIDLRPHPIPCRLSVRKKGRTRMPVDNLEVSLRRRRLHLGRVDKSDAQGVLNVIQAGIRVSAWRAHFWASSRREARLARVSQSSV